MDRKLPCQPFSVAGQRQGSADRRHLWPEFKRLIGDRKPATVFGEQVASADGRIWLSGVRADLEALGYAVGSADLCAAGVGAPHIRQRLWWVADSTRNGLERSGGQNGGGSNAGIPPHGNYGRSWSCRTLNAGMGWGQYDILPCFDGKSRRVESGTFPLAHGISERVGKLRAFGNAIVPQLAAEFIAAYIEVLRSTTQESDSQAETPGLTE